MEVDTHKADLYVMELLHNLQDAHKLKETERLLESAALVDIIPPLIRIINKRVENPEEASVQQTRILCQSAAINLKNALMQKYHCRYREFFVNHAEVASNLLDELVRILVK